MAYANPFGENAILEAARNCHMRFAVSRNPSRTVCFPHPKGDCTICMDDSGLKMQCGHYICPDDLLHLAWDQVKVMKYEITCAACSFIIPVEDILKFGLPEKEEELFLTTAITTNFYESQDINECPQCRSLCSRQRSDTPKVHCTICPKKGVNPFMFCWYCLREWRNMGNPQICGNKDCKRESIQTLISSSKIDLIDANGKTISIPKWRACPNKSCSTIVECNADHCNTIMCCKCKLMFCFICLSAKSGVSLDCKSKSFKSSDIKCVPAPIQTKL